MPDFVVAGSDGTVEIPGLTGSLTSGLLRRSTPGAFSIGYVSRHRVITLDGRTFTAHLAHEGLDAGQSQRKLSGLTDSPATEGYVKFAKSLLKVDLDQSNNAMVWPQLGHALEIVLKCDPTKKDFDGKLRGRVALHGDRCPDLLVSAHSKELKTPVETRTDTDGRFCIALPHSGFWIINTVQMSPSSSDKTDWESMWASLTFQN